MLFSILIVPIKLIVKIFLYSISLVIYIFSLAVGLLSGLSNGICSTIASLGFLATSYWLYEVFNQLKDYWHSILSMYLTFLLFYLIPRIGEKITSLLMLISKLIKDFANEISLGRKRVYQQADESHEEKLIEEEKSENNMSFLFNGITTAEELKKRYIELSKCYHPDVSVGETTDTMQYINNEYDRLKEQFAQ